MTQPSTMTRLTDTTSPSIQRTHKKVLSRDSFVNDVAWIAVLEKDGFTEVSRAWSYAPGLGREVEEVLLTLLPALDGA